MNVMSLDPEQRLVHLMSEHYRRESVERDRASLPSSFSMYVQDAWRVVEPATDYLHNWHIDAIAEHLSAVMKGQIRNLVITMPPRHMKSLCLSVMWPTWVWIDSPGYRFLYSSYAHTLSIRDALKSRRLLQSTWYQDRWGDHFSLTGDQNAKMRYDNDHGGYRIATSVGGTTTGEGGDAIVVDDPHNIKEIHSDVIREGVIEWWDHVMSTRLNDPKRGVRVITMQRGHEADLAGHLLKKKGWEHLNLPAEFELDKRKTSIGWSDPRTKKGELLWPNRFGPAEIAQLKEELGDYGTASQLQQRPSPEEGGIFKKQWFKLWPADAKIPVLDYVIQSYDTAFTEKTHSDASACTAWGVFKHPKLKHNCVLLLDAWADKLDYVDLRKRVKGDLKALYGEKDSESRADIVLVEEKGSGITLLQDLRMLKVPAYGYNPNKADKLVRAHASAPFVFAGRVYLLESEKRKGTFVSWADEFMHEMMLFPNGQSDNYVDTFTQTMLLLRNKEMLEARVGGFAEDEEQQIPLEEDYTNPYAA